jgi:[acyl-carrier-protein] S-malonyltransferase
MFSGQGSHVVGMGKDLADKWEVARHIFEDADDSLRAPISRFMFEGPAEELKPTPIAQPAIVAHGMAIIEVLRSELGRDPLTNACAVIGHSIGELTGYCAAGGFSTATAIKIAHQRGIFMQAATPVTYATGMMAVFPLNLTQAKSLVLEVSNQLPKAVLDIACINSPKQIVLSGDKQALDLAAQLASEGFVGNQKIACIHLDVSAPFHSRYMERCHKALEKIIDPLKIKITPMPIISGRSNKLHRIVPNNLVEDFIPLSSSTVNFLGCIEQANNILRTQPTKVETPLWIEVGPKPTLTSFLKQTLPNPGIIVSLSTADDIQAFLQDQSIQNILFPDGSPPKKK